MLQVLKVKFEDGNQTLNVPDDLEIIANLYADLSGTILLVKTNGTIVTPAPAEPAQAIIPEVVNLPEETRLES